MKKFHFALDPLLERRRHIENEFAAAAASAQTELQKAETRLGVLNDAPHEERSAVVTARELQLRESIQSQIMLTRTAILYLREAVTAAEAELQSAARERKIIERLRDRRLKTHHETQIRAEQRDIEESNQCRPSGSSIFSRSSS